MTDRSVHPEKRYFPSGTVTFLFTDIQGSTKLAREHPEAWEAARARHHVILRGAIESNLGYVFQIVGDAFCAAFHTAAEAVKAAIKAQYELQNEPWGEVIIQVRMGIHTGEAETDGKDYRGYLTMSLVQRLMSAGHGGQILLSDATEKLLREKLPKGVHLHDMGEHKFKDIPHSIRVFQGTAPGLQVDFPHLRTLDARPNNLPVQLTSFVGREKELTDVKRLLPNAHMLTLIGPGGTGKTRLSVEAGSQMLDQYPDGVWIVELAPILDPILVLRTTAIAIGLRDEPQRPIIDMLCDFLLRKKMLIILDNCEHLVDACAHMADRILRSAPDVRILASSREALGIGGEVTYRVPSLGLPDPFNMPPPASLGQYEAVRLFIDRAISAVPTFTVTNENAPALAQICDRLDGIPLAIELAAAKIRVLSLDQIAKRLDDRFRLLTGGSRTALEHHQTLRAAIDWSFILLPPAEQLLFSRLSVFMGGWTLEAAEAVCSDASLESGDVLDLLEHLINKSMVIMEETQYETRYHMLETMRQYATEKLVEADVLHKQHAFYFLVLAETIEPFLEKPEPVGWLDQLEREHNNLRAALRWMRDKGQVESGLRLASALCQFWLMRGYLSEGRTQMEGLLSLPEGTIHPSVRAKALNYAGMLARYQGDLVGAHKLIAESLSIYREKGEHEGIANSLANLGFVYLHEDDFAEARRYYSEALSIYRELDNKQGIADALSHLALMSFYEGNYESALALNESSLAIWRDLGDQQGIAWALHHLGNVKLKQGEYPAARELFRQSLGIANQVNFKWGIAFSIEGLAAVAACTGQEERAILLASYAAKIRQVIGIPLGARVQTDFDQILAPAQMSLDEKTREAIRSKGLNLNMEQVVAEAQTVM